MWSSAETPDVLVAFGTLMAGSAAIWGAVTAHRGLKSWKAQQIWLRDSELVKRLLIALFERHDAVNRLRSPLSYSSREALNDPAKRFEEVRTDYQDRLKPLNEARKSFYANSNEAKAIWGDELEQLAKSIVSLEADLSIVVEDHLRSVDPNNHEEENPNRDERNRDRRVLYGSGGQKDEFGNRYAEAIARLEEFLREKLQP